MRAIHFTAIAAAGLFAGSCGEPRQCEPLTRADALQLAREAKSGMLRRSTDDYAANFATSDATFVRLGSETNGYAANVGFRGRDGRMLVALIEGDCYIGWTSH